MNDYINTPFQPTLSNTTQPTIYNGSSQTGNYSQLSSQGNNAYAKTLGNYSADASGPQDNSMWDSADDILGTTGKAIGAASSLANIYLGFQSLGLAKEEMGMKKEQWNMAKTELKHMQNTRKKLTASYMR